MKQSLSCRVQYGKEDLSYKFFVLFYSLDSKWNDGLPDKGLMTNLIMAMFSFSTRLLTFVLSTYVIQLITMYHMGARSKARDMMYGCFRAVDCLTVSLDYDRQYQTILAETAPRDDGHRALCPGRCGVVEFVG